MVYEKKLVLPKDDAEYINRLLTTVDLMGEDDTISNTVEFDGGFEMDIKLCGADGDYPWTEAVLFDESGNQIGYTDVSDEYFGKWEIEDEENKYIVIVDVE